MTVITDTKVRNRFDMTARLRLTGDPARERAGAFFPHSNGWDVHFIEIEFSGKFQTYIVSDAGPDTDYAVFAATSTGRVAYNIPAILMTIPRCHAGSVVDILNYMIAPENLADDWRSRFREEADKWDDTPALDDQPPHARVAFAMSILFE